MIDTVIEIIKLFDLNWMSHLPVDASDRAQDLDTFIRYIHYLMLALFEAGPVTICTSCGSLASTNQRRLIIGGLRAMLRPH